VTAPPAQEKVEPKTQAVAAQSKSLLVFGNVEHIQQARKPRQKQASAKTSVSSQEVKSKANAQVVQATATSVRSVASPKRASSEKAETKLQPVQSKSLLVFGNVEHIQQARQRRKISNASVKSTTKKTVIHYAEWPACGVIEEKMPTNKPKAVPGMPYTLWDLESFAA
jgi:hypothetical protein